MGLMITMHFLPFLLEFLWVYGFFQKSTSDVEGPPGDTCCKALFEGSLMNRLAVRRRPPGDAN